MFIKSQRIANINIIGENQINFKLFAPAFYGEAFART
jgi:hypothetical protein